MSIFPFREYSSISVVEERLIVSVAAGGGDDEDDDVVPNDTMGYGTMG